MIDAASGIADRSAQLRREFDRSFAETPPAHAIDNVDFLSIRVATRCFAVRLAEISGLFVDKKITRTPGAATIQLGIANFRGSIVPVYDLSSLLGYSAVAKPRWLVVAAAAPVAFGFEAFEAHLRVPDKAIMREQAPDGPRNFTQGLVRNETLLRPIIHLPSLVDALKL